MAVVVVGEFMKVPTLGNAMVIFSRMQKNYAHIVNLHGLGVIGLENLDKVLQ